jgi:hypothetical protein
MTEPSAKSIKELIGSIQRKLDRTDSNLDVLLAERALMKAFVKDVAEIAIDDPTPYSSAKMIPRGVWDQAVRLNKTLLNLDIEEDGDTMDNESPDDIKDVENE